ncbi:protein of unknown function [Pseudomonas mediterranea]
MYQTDCVDCLGAAPQPNGAVRRFAKSPRHKNPTAFTTGHFVETFCAARQSSARHRQYEVIWHGRDT